MSGFAPVSMAVPDRAPVDSRARDDLVALFGDMIGISVRFGDGVLRRHHRSPAMAARPAGQDPGRAHGPSGARQ